MFNRLESINCAKARLLLVAVLLLAIPLQAHSVSFAQHAPKAITQSTTFNFGDVYRGEIISQIFMIKNDGDVELKLFDFKGGCGCEATSWDRSILPGKEGKAVLEVQTVSQSGAIAKTAALQTNDPERPTITFTLSANVLEGAPLRQGKYIGPIFLSPDSRAALYSVTGKKASMEFSITADNKPVKVLRVEAGTKNFAARVEVVEPGKSYKLILEAMPMMKADLYVDQLRVITDSDSLPAFTIDVSLRVYAGQ